MARPEAENNVPRLIFDPTGFDNYEKLWGRSLRVEMTPKMTEEEFIEWLRKEEVRFLKKLRKRRPDLLSEESWQRYWEIYGISEDQEED